MGRFLAIFGAIILIIMVAFYLGWFGVTSTSSDSNHEKVEVTMDKSKIREDTAKVTDGAKELSREASDGLKKIATKVENGISSRQKPLLEADKKSIELEPGACATVTVTRKGSDLLAAHLTLTPSASSNLLATGGEFKAGETTTAIVIKAPAGAKDGSINVEGNGDSQHVDVTVKNKI